MRIYFDLETNGLLKDVSKVWCIATVNIDNPEDTRLWVEDEIDTCLEYLYQADELSGHNIIGYDLKVLLKLYNWGPRPSCNLIDTVVLARLKHANVKDTDVALLGKGMPNELYGRHTLRAWGWRLGEHKGDYSGGWLEYSQEMGDYCLQDTKTGVKLYHHLVDEGYPKGPFSLSPELPTSASASPKPDGTSTSVAPVSSTVN